MKEIKKLTEILKQHELWLNTNGEKGERANLSGANLPYSNLEGANLENADLSGANLTYANLTYVDLSNADLSNANLSYANLFCTNLTGADLTYANLFSANLFCTNLFSADLTHANLFCAHLSNTNLSNANLYSASLLEANLSNVKAKNTAYFDLQCPLKGSFIGYKKASNCLVTLEITEDALRSSATTKKCRCSKAKVLSIKKINTNKEVLKTLSDYDRDFKYELNKIVEVDYFDTDRWNECASGIHFFMDKKDAIEY